MVQDIFWIIAMGCTGYLFFAFGVMQLIVSVFTSIPTTKKISSFGPVDAKKIYKQITITIALWIIVTAFAVMIALESDTPSMRFGFFLGIGVACITSLGKWGLRCNMDDYVKTYGKYISEEALNGLQRYYVEKYLGIQPQKEPEPANIRNEQDKSGNINSLIKEKQRELSQASNDALNAKKKAKQLNNEISALSKLNRGQKTVKCSTAIGMVALAVFLTVLITAGVLSDSSNSAEEAYTEGYDVGYEEGHLAGVRSQSPVITAANQRLADIRPEYKFFHDNAVICTTQGYRYHRYDCPHLKDTPYYIFNIEYAEAMGYSPCLDCW